MKPNSAASSTTQEPKENWQTGKIVDARGLDGCQFLIETKEGQKLQAINLEDSWKQDGLKVRFKAQKVTGMMSICMAGPMVKLTAIEKIE